ncbi:hypothetical protein SAMD00019534_098720, partial [Acytostelium subglobosum LB1]|uniref:hypothetical protein n=1 Tax=Acytostelium subglobosum LB1 TaxID=1410327 RepID=UPI000644F29E
MNDISTIPNLLLQYILSNVESNIDKICLSMSCKRLFNQRPYYLRLRCECRMSNERYRAVSLTSFTQQLVQVDPPPVLTLQQLKDQRNVPSKMIWTIDTSVAANAIPAAVTDLEFGMAFNQPLKPGALPLTIRKLILGEQFRKVLMPGSIPPLVEVLKFGTDYNIPLVQGILPNSLRKLDLSRCSVILNKSAPLPAGITSLSLPNQQIPIIFLPPNLLHLKLPRDYSHRLQHLPESVRTIKGSFMEDTNFKWIPSIPSHLETLQVTVLTMRLDPTRILSYTFKPLIHINTVVLNLAREDRFFIRRLDRRSALVVVERTMEGFIAPIDQFARHFLRFRTELLRLEWV